MEALLAGTPLLNDALEGRERLSRSYHALFPVLSEHMPEVFPAALYTFENYRAAVELWGAYGMQVQTEGGGEAVTCLPTVAFLCNHNVHPHVVRYSRLRGGYLHLPVARSIPAGVEVIVSYGPKQNAELLLFYGFAIPNNPYDEVPITFTIPDGESPEVTAARQSILSRHGLGLQHTIRRGPLATGLIATLRLLTADAASLSAFTGDARVSPVSAEGEASAAATLCATTEALQEQAMAGDAVAAGSVGAGLWDLPRETGEACRAYRAGLKGVLDAAMQEANAWRMLAGPTVAGQLGKRTRD